MYKSGSGYLNLTHFEPPLEVPIDSSIVGEREGSGELLATCADLWHFNLTNLRNWSATAPNFDLLPYILNRTNQSL